MTASDGRAGEATLRGLSRIAEFRALWLANLQSVAGDQMARVALTIAVFQTSRSALLSALTYAATIVSAVAGGLLLGRLADRFPRRAVMIGADLVRAAVVMLMTLPGLGLPGLVALLAVVTFCQAPFTTARAAVFPVVLPGDLYTLGTAVTQTANRAAVMAGSAAGGAITASFGLRPALWADAASFAVSALLVRYGVRARPAAGSASDSAVGADGRAAGPLGAVRLVATNSRLRTPLLLGCMLAFTAVPEALAAPLARAAGSGPAGSGLILAALAAGAAVGMVGFTWLVPAAARQRWLAPLAVASCAALAVAAANPGLTALLVIMLVSGLFLCYQAPCNAAFVAAAPDKYRSQVFGIAVAVLAASQAAGMLIAGAAVSRFAPATVVASSGVTGSVLASALLLGRRFRLRRQAHQPVGGQVAK